jgi:hypothetical protein
MPQEDIPSSIDYKDQGLTVEEIRRGARTGAGTSSLEDLPSSLEDLPSSIDYKDQGLTVEELRNREAGRRGNPGRRAPRTTDSQTAAQNEGFIIVEAVAVPGDLDLPAGAAPKTPTEDTGPSQSRGFSERFMLRAALGLVAVVAVVALTVVAVLVLGGSSGEESNSSPTQLGQTLVGAAAFDEFGSAIALSSDGLTMAAGAPSNGDNGFGSGHARIFEYNAGSARWNQLGQTLVGAAALDLFGSAIALSADGLTMAAGAPLNEDNGSIFGQARIFAYNAGSARWNQLGQTLVGAAADDEFGSAIALSSDGRVVAVGSVGEALVFGYNAGTEVWEPLGQSLTGERDSFFSQRLSLSADGRTLALGEDTFASGDGRVSVFEYNAASDSWGQLGQAIVGEVTSGAFGFSVAISSDGRTIAGGGPFGGGGGLVRVLEYNTESGTWEPLGQTLIAEVVGDRFGWSVDLSSDGRTLAVGAPDNDNDNGSGAGHVRVFGYNAESGLWNPRGQDLDGVAPGDDFGISVALSADGRTVAGGADDNDDNGFIAGHVRVFVG